MGIIYILHGIIDDKTSPSEIVFLISKLKLLIMQDHSTLNGKDDIYLKAEGIKFLPS